MIRLSILFEIVFVRDVMRAIVSEALEELLLFDVDFDEMEIGGGIKGFCD